MPLDLFPYQHGPRNINSCVRLRRDGVAEALHRLLEAEEQAAPTKESERRTMSIYSWLLVLISMPCFRLGNDSSW